MACVGSIWTLRAALCVAQSEWKGYVTVPKGGRQRRVSMTQGPPETILSSTNSPAINRDPLATTVVLLLDHCAHA